MKRIRLFRRRRPNPVVRVAKAASALTTATAAMIAGAAGAWIAYSNRSIPHKLHLPEAIPAERDTLESPSAGRISYYFAEERPGRPLLLVHSVNAAASAYEMRPLFEHYRLERPVYAIDLPGYGFSERSEREFSPRTFQYALIDLLEQRIQQPADVVALSLGAEFAALAAQQRPDLFHSLVLISPSGLGDRGSRASQSMEEQGLGYVVHEILSAPLWGRPLFDLIATRRSIQYFLSQSFTGAIPQGFVDYAYQTSHQPGAEYVPLYFISGRLFTPNVLDRVYATLQTPTLVLYDKDAFVNFDRLPELLEKNPNWQAQRIQGTRGLPQFEKPDETIQAMDSFWKSLGAGETKTAGLEA
jgi:pimeloyl-ACP methyl ester carboxylesterase